MAVGLASNSMRRLSRSAVQRAPLARGPRAF